MERTPPRQAHHRCTGASQARASLACALRSACILGAQRMLVRTQASTVGLSCANGRTHLRMRTCQELSTCLGLRIPMVVRPCSMSPDCACPGACGPVQHAPKAVDAKGRAPMTAYAQDSTHPGACDVQGSMPWCARSQSCPCPGLCTPRGKRVHLGPHVCFARSEVVLRACRSVVMFRRICNNFPLLVSCG